VRGCLLAAGANFFVHMFINSCARICSQELLDFSEKAQQQLVAAAIDP
jgi:hypothetical protein